MLSYGDTKTLVALANEQVSVRCPVSSNENTRWLKQTAAAGSTDGDGDGDSRRVLVSMRRRLVLDASGSQSHDGVYLCVVAGVSSPTVARLMANLTILSPCEPLVRCYF